MKNAYMLLSVIVGVFVIALLLYKDINGGSSYNIVFDSKMILGIILAIMFFFFQNIFMIWRYRLLIDDKFSWASAFRVNTFCEFVSAITPSSVGGAPFITFFLNKEGLNAGKATSIMMASLFLDELFLSASTVIIVFLFPLKELFGIDTIITSSIKYIFFFILFAIILWTLILFIALFLRPQWVKKILIKLFSFSILLKWKNNIEIFSDNIVVSSNEIKKYKINIWLKLALATCLGWCFRYSVVNALIFSVSSECNHILAFTRQFLLWIVSIAAPMPGGSGVNEYMFKVYYSEFFPNATTTIFIALVWRIITYYSYLVIGVIIFPNIFKTKIARA